MPGILLSMGYAFRETALPMMTKRIARYVELDFGLWVASAISSIAVDLIIYAACNAHRASLSMGIGYAPPVLAKPTTLLPVDAWDVSLA